MWCDARADDLCSVCMVYVACITFSVVCDVCYVLHWCPMYSMVQCVCSVVAGCAGCIFRWEQLFIPGQAKHLELGAEGQERAGRKATSLNPLIFFPNLGFLSSCWGPFGYLATEFHFANAHAPFSPGGGVLLCGPIRPELLMMLAPIFWAPTFHSSITERGMLKSSTVIGDWGQAKYTQVYSDDCILLMKSLFVGVSCLSDRKTFGQAGLFFLFAFLIFFFLLGTSDLLHKVESCFLFACLSSIRKTMFSTGIANVLR